MDLATMSVAELEAEKSRRAKEAAALLDSIAEVEEEIQKKLPALRSANRALGMLNSLTREERSVVVKALAAEIEASSKNAEVSR